MLRGSSNPAVSEIIVALDGALRSVDETVEVMPRAQRIGNKWAAAKIGESGGSTGAGTTTATDAARHGWDAPGVADHPARPDPASIRLTDERRTHILDGEEAGGGHRHGTGKPGKTEFPAAWSDDQIAVDVVDIARSPDEPPVHQNWNDRWRVRGSREGVEIVAIVESDGGIWTAWPLEGGPGVVKNSEED